MNILSLLIVGLSSVLSFDERVIKHHSTIIPPSWVEIGKPPSDLVLEFGLLLPQKNIDILENLLINTSNPNNRNYGNWLTKNQVDTIISTELKNFEVIKDWLSNTISNYT